MKEHITLRALAILRKGRFDDGDPVNTTHCGAEYDDTRDIGSYDVRGDFGEPACFECLKGLILAKEGRNMTKAQKVSLAEMVMELGAKEFAERCLRLSKDDKTPRDLRFYSYKIYAGTAARPQSEPKAAKKRRSE